jgi:hypothetical protein
MPAAAALMQMTQIAANLFRHGSQKADVQQARHGIVNLPQSETVDQLRQICRELCDLFSDAETSDTAA